MMGGEHMKVHVNLSIDHDIMIKIREIAQKEDKSTSGLTEEIYTDYIESFSEGDD